ncbi:MAG: glycosyltransferase [Bifidobacteriaceae bacterium]|jgi:glycosyltransferase involved in cell wall biosynthesis|nr:glycosyltransferase [Bifidobacteriaceae bacterium]
MRSDGLKGASVLHVSQPSDGGVAAVVRGLASYQAGLGLRVAVACDPAGDLGLALAGAGVEVRPWRAVRSPVAGMGREAVALGHVVADFRPDVVHLHAAKAGLAGRLAVRGRVRTVFEPHGWSWWAVEGPAAFAAKAWERAALCWTHQVVCLSREEALALPPCWDRLAMARNGVDLDHWSPRPQAAARRRLGLPPDAVLLVCVARLCRQKGQDLLVEAFSRLVGDGLAASLALVGDGPLLGQTRRLAGRLPVVFPGAVEDPRDWYAAADVVVLPSRWEAAALAALEAAAMGRPVVATAVGDVKECPALGARPAPGDPAALAEALGALLANPAARSQAAAEGRRWALDRHADAWAHARLTEIAIGQAGMTPVLADGGPGAVASWP